MPSPTVSRVLLPYFRNELPGWGRLYKQFVGPPQSSCWKDAGARVIRGKLHGYYMRLHLDSWSERSTYFLGRYYDIETQEVFKILIDTGDTVWDVGANIGMMSLLAARLVGPRGRVDCFEPNPTCVRRLNDHVKLNQLINVTVHHTALADENCEMQLTVPNDDSVMATLTKFSDDDHAIITELIRVPVRTGDGLFDHTNIIPRLIKIDVEGFELRTLMGLKKTLISCRPAIVLEFVEAHLKRAGADRLQIASFLDSIGYCGFTYTSRRRGHRHLLTFEAIDPSDPSGGSDNSLWVHPEDERLERISVSI